MVKIFGILARSLVDLGMSIYLSGCSNSQSRCRSESTLNLPHNIVQVVDIRPLQTDYSTHGVFHRLIPRTLVCLIRRQFFIHWASRAVSTDPHAADGTNQSSPARQITRCCMALMRDTTAIPL